MMQHWQPRERLDAILDTCIDQLTTTPPERVLVRYPQSAPSLRPLLQVASALQQMGAVEMPASAKRADRERIRRAVMAQRRRQRRPHLPPGLTRMALWTAALMLVIASGLGSVTVASASALPPDRLYGWKRASEEIWLRAQPSPARAATVALGYVDRRVDETVQLYRRTRHLEIAQVAAIGAAYAQALDLIAAVPGDDESLLATLQSKSDQHAVRLAAIAEHADDEDRPLLNAASEVAQWARTAKPGDAPRIPANPAPQIAPVPAPSRPAAPPESQPAAPVESRPAAPVESRPAAPAAAPAARPSAAPGRTDSPPGQRDPAPGQSDSPPGPPPSAPGQSDSPPGRGVAPEVPPGQEKKDRSADATPTPELGRDAAPSSERGSSESAPGRSDTPPPGQERGAEPTDTPDESGSRGKNSGGPPDGTDSKGRNDP
jgi:hypothetical protein